MNVLIACEFSGTVREAFAAKGHYALSCDTLPTDRVCTNGSEHYTGTIQNLLREKQAPYWDLMIAHPPCTYLATCGIHWNNKIEGRAEKTEQALEFVQWLMDLKIPKICVENPVSIISTRIRKPDQIIHPFMFGEPVYKKTCLWLKDLPLLTPVNPVAPPKPIYVDKSGKKRHFVDSIGPSPERAKIRSKTFEGIAQAMANTWG